MQWFKVQGNLRFLHRGISEQLSWRIWRNNFFLREIAVRVIIYPIFSTIAACMYFTRFNIAFFESLFFHSVVLIYCTNYLIPFCTNPLIIIFLFCLRCNIFSTLDTYTTIFDIYFPLYNLFLFCVIVCKHNICVGLIFSSVLVYRM